MAWQDRAYNQQGGDLRLGFTPPSSMSLYVIGACVVGFIVQAAMRDLRTFDEIGRVTRWCGLTFEGGRAFVQPWRWVTYQYLHADSMHIFFNILGIYFFLPPLERLWGGRNAFAFYTAGGLVAGAAYGVLSAMVHFHVPLIGASGSILATLGACALLFPEKQVLLFFFPIPIRLLAVLLGLLYALTIIGEQNLSNAAHLGGLVFGVVGPLYGGPLLRSTVRRFAEQRRASESRAIEDEQRQIDAILEKVSQHGMQSLTRRERKTLKRATEHQRQRDLETAHKRRSF